MTSRPKTEFLSIIEEHTGIIQSLCSIYCPTVEDQQDMRQDVVLQLWKAFPSFRAQSKTSTWLYRVALNTILNKKKKEARRPGHAPLNGLEQSGLYATSPTDDNLQLLKQIIAQLPDLEKAIMVLHLEGYQNKEIAEMLNLSATNISTRMHRIKNRLKENFKRQSYVTRKI
jgi:RNA polymerase sigma-70 factor (ECF subfamily)